MERRGFLRNVALGTVAVSWLGARRGPTVLAAAGIDKPAVLGGTPIYKGGFTSWPQWRQDWEPAILKSADDQIDMPEFGLRCRVVDLYRGTPLDPQRAAS